VIGACIPDLPPHECQVIMTRSKCFRRYSALWLSITVTVLFILLTSMGCSLSSPGAPRPTPTPVPTGTVPQFGHVVLVVEENSSYSEVIGGSEMPYLNSLATQYGLATQYFANTHPSIGNYFMLTTGQIVTNDDSFAGRVDVDNIVRELLASGKSWKSYAESRNDPLLYAKRHDPLSYFSDVVDSKPGVLYHSCNRQFDDPPAVQTVGTVSHAESNGCMLQIRRNPLNGHRCD
jgi:hypothetical protein